RADREPCDGAHPLPARPRRRRIGGRGLPSSRFMYKSAMRPRRGVACLTLALSTSLHAGELASAPYFPLRVGNWWAYAERSEEGSILSRETWSLVEGDAGEFHLRSFTKRLDALGRTRNRFEGH